MAERPSGAAAHFGAGARAFAAPKIAAPTVTAPHFSAPSPYSARNIRTPLTTPVAPQLFARPGYLQHVTPGQVGSAPLPRSVRQIPRPMNQAANAFALSGVHRFDSSQILHNPLFANRPALAHMVFRGRFALFFPTSPTFSADHRCWLHRTAVLAICVQ